MVKVAPDTVGVWEPEEPNAGWKEPGPTILVVTLALIPLPPILLAVPLVLPCDQDGEKEDDQLRFVCAGTKLLNNSKAMPAMSRFFLIVDIGGFNT